jgi:hypothetical protein
VASTKRETLGSKRRSVLFCREFDADTESHIGVQGRTANRNSPTPERDAEGDAMEE